MIDYFGLFLDLINKHDLFVLVDNSNSYTIYTRQHNVIATIYNRDTTVTYYSGVYYCFGYGDTAQRVTIYNETDLFEALDAHITYLFSHTIHNIYADALNEILIKLSLLENA